MRAYLPSSVNLETREVVYLSPSQLQTFSSKHGGCPRKWYFEKVLKRKTKQSKSQELGEVVHAQIEHYLKTGQDGLGEIARAGKPYLPTPARDSLEVETAIEPTEEVAKGAKVWADGTSVPEGYTARSRYWESPVTAAGIPVIGRIDWRDIADPVCPEIGDNKTSGDRKYMKTSTELANNIQMLTYGEDVRQTRPHATHARLSHVYFGTRSRWAEKRTVVVPLTTVKERWQGDITPVAEQLKQVARLNVIQDVPANTAVCNDFGGCPHMSECPRSIMEYFSMDLMNYKRAAPAAPAVPATPAPASAPATVKVAYPPTAPGLTAVLRDGKVIQPAVQSVKGASYSVQQQDALGIQADGTPRQLNIVDHMENKDTIAPVPIPARILPEDAPASDPVMAAEGIVGQRHTTQDGRTYVWSVKHDKAAWRPAVDEPVDAAAVAVDATTMVPEPAPKARRGRPTRGEKLMASSDVSGGQASQVGAAPSPVSVAMTPEAPRMAGPSVPPPPSEVAQGGLSGGVQVGTPTVGYALFIDCAPDGLACRTLDKYVAELAERVCAHFKVVDIGLVEYQNGYAALRAAARANPPPPYLYTIRTSPMTQPVIDALAPGASMVVRRAS